MKLNFMYRAEEYEVQKCKLFQYIVSPSLVVQNNSYFKINLKRLF